MSEAKLDRILDLIHKINQKKQPKPRVKIVTRRDIPAVAMIYFFFFWLTGAYPRIANLYLTGHIDANLVASILAAMFMPLGIFFFIIMCRVLKLIFIKKGII